MSKFYDTHRDLFGAKEIDETGTKYTKLNVTGTDVVEEWIKVDGEWIDNTEKASKELREKVMRRRREFMERKKLSDTILSMTEHSTEADQIFKDFIIGGRHD